MGWAAGSEVFNRVARDLINIRATEWAKRQVLGNLINELRDMGWDTIDESLYEFRNDPVIAGLFKEHGFELPGDVGPIGEIIPTKMRVRIDFETVIDVTDDLVEIARNEELTFEEVLEEAKRDPAQYLDHILSDLDWEQGIEFITS